MMNYAYIYDSENRYAEKLGGYLNMSEAFPFTTKVSATEKELIGISEKNPPKLLLLAENNFEVIKKIDCNDVFILSDSKSGEYEGIKYIGKYQSGDKIIKDILGFMADSQTIGSIAKRKTSMKVISLFSPVKRSLSTTMGLAMGQILSRRSKTLYISFECFSGLSKMLDCEFQKNVGDLLYFMSTHETGFDAAMASIVEKSEGLDILAGFDNQMDLINVGSNIWIELLEKLERETEYEYIFLDLSEAVQGLFDILNMSDKVITAVDNDEVALFKLKQYEECLMASGYEEVLEKTKKCNVPHQHRRNGEICFLGFGELGDYVKNVLQGVLERESIG